VRRSVGGCEEEETGGASAWQRARRRRERRGRARARQTIRVVNTHHLV
jgi:hypothetical protein